MTNIAVFYDSETKKFRNMVPHPKHEGDAMRKEWAKMRKTSVRFWALSLEGRGASFLGYIAEQLYYCKAQEGTGFFNKQKTKVYFCAVTSIHMVTRFIEEVTQDEYDKVVLNDRDGAIWRADRIIQIKDHGYTS